MNIQKLILDLSDLAVESIEVNPADSLDLASYGHGMEEFDASCIPPVFCSCFMPDESDDA